jgi:WD domain, G-beta repeat
MKHQGPATSSFLRPLAAVLAGLGLLAAVPGRGDPPKPLSEEAIKERQTKFRAERADADKTGLTKQFSPEWFDRADELAKSGDAALADGRLLEARDSFRKARAELPGLAADFPKHVARVFGDGRLRHTHWVQCVAYSPDGKKLVTCSQDGSVKLWDAETRRELRSYTGHTDAVRAVAIAPDNKTVASAGGDKEIKLWDAETGKDIRGLTGHTEFLTSIAFSPDGKHLVSGSEDKTIRIWPPDGKIDP